MRIAVIGAGIVGTMTAYYLAKKGYEVTVFDREDYPAMKCSRANGGQISVCNAETWNTWQNVSKGLKWMFQKDAPLLMRPSLDPSKLAWLAGFMYHTATNTYKKNTIETIRLGLESRELYEQVIEEEGLVFDGLKAGMLHVYTNSKSFEQAREAGKMFTNAGVEWNEIRPQEIRELDPGMRSYRRLVGGFVTPSDWTGDAHLFCQKMMDVLIHKYGVQYNLGVEVTSTADKCVHFEHLGYENKQQFNAIVLCNGHEIAKSAWEHNDFLNVYPVKGYSITINNAKLAPSISLLDDDVKIVTSKLGDRFRVAGTAELAGANYDITRSRIEPLLKYVKANFPILDLSDYSQWACLRPMSADLMPIMRESKQAGTWYHGGHGHLGWTLSAVTAKHLAERI